jgi:signal transduction histidine kinase
MNSDGNSMPAGHLVRLTEVPQLEAANVRLVADARLGLIVLAWLIEITQPTGEHGLVLGVLLVYALFCALQLNAAKGGRGGRFVSYAPWVDAAFYCGISILAGGLMSGYTLFLLFPVLVVSSRSGLKAGLALALACLLWFAAVNAMSGSPVASVDLPQPALGWMGFILLVGLMLARWGHSEYTLRRRLAFSSEINRLFSPRHELEYALYRLSELLRTYGRADASVLIVANPRSSGWLLYKIEASHAGVPVRPETIDAELARALLAIPADQIAMYARRGVPWGGPAACAYDCASMERRPADLSALTGLAHLLEAHSFLSLPIRSRSETLGRIHLTSRHPIYTRSDAQFFAHIMSQAGLLIDNMQLVERLAREVATDERRRISRDLHDATIQPYIGLKLGLEALCRRVAPGDPLAREVDDLMKMAGDGIVQLRSYVGRLKREERRQERVSLLPAIRLQADKFSQFYGIDAQVLAEGDILVRERIFDEIMNIVREGLSNMRRHTRTKRAVIRLRESSGRLVIEFVNENDEPTGGPPGFVPRSLTERATELGGSVRVDPRADGHTVVAVEIPI